MNNVFIDFLLAHLGFTIFTSIIILAIIVDIILIITFTIIDKMKKNAAKIS